MALFDRNIFGKQLVQESGKRQFNRDGSVVRSPKGALGIAQVMPTTGPEAARLAGLPWDANKLASDPDYNLKLGEAYKTEMLRIFGGDERKATAAYNAGPGDPNKGGRGVRGAIRRATAAGRPNDWEAFLPRETQDYVSRILGGGRRTMSGSPLVPRKREIESIGDGTSNDSPVVNPFNVGPELQERAGAVESELAGQRAFLQRQAATLEQVQEQRRQRTEQTVAETGGILDTVKDANRALLQNVQPLLQRQQAVADRMAKLATMNPLEKGLRGIFDLNFNEEYLGEVNQKLLSAIQSQGQNYQFVATLQEQYMKTIAMKNENEGMLESLTLQELDEDGKMAAQGLNSAITSFGFLNQQVDANASTIRAQILTRSNMLDQMSAGQINGLLEEAKKSPDRKVQLDGVVIGVGELQERSNRWDQQQLALDSAQLALQSNQLELADRQSRRIVDTMTEAQLQEAAANNGVYKGIQLPSDSITQALHTYAVRREVQTTTFLQKGGGKTGVQAAQFTIQYMKDTRDRIRQLDPKMTPALNQTTIQISTRLDQLMKQLVEAQKQGLGDTVGVAITEEIGKLHQAYDKELTNAANRFAGGSPLGGRVMLAFLKGDPINSNEGMQMMQEFVKQGGLPTAMKTSPTFRAIYQTVEKAGQQVDASLRSQGRKVNEQERNRLVMQQIQREAPARVNAANFEQLFTAIPDIAKSMNHDFGAVSREEFLQAQQRGNAEAYSKIASRLGVSPSDAQKIFSGNWQKPANMDPAAAKQITDRASTLKGELLRIQREAFLTALDEGPSAKGGFKPSRSYIDLLSTNGFNQRVDKFQQMQRSYSFGDAVASSVGDGNLVQTAVDYTNSMRSIANAKDIQQISATRATREAYLIPQKRTQAILGAIDNLNQQDEQLLLNAMSRGVQGFRDPRGTNSGEVNTSIRNFIVGQKFQDPNLERIRKIAAANWDATAKQFDRAIGRMSIENYDFNPSEAGRAVTNMLGNPGGKLLGDLIYGSEE